MKRITEQKSRFWRDGGMEGGGVKRPIPLTKTWGLRIVLAAIAVLQLTGCSKTVQWEEEVPLNTGETICASSSRMYKNGEEVPLNTGETIWVKRTVKYTYQGGAGNPLDMAYRPNWPEVAEFTWNGKTYRYEGDARISLLAISPQKRPVLVARAADSSWNWAHRYACTVPFYVQLVPDDTGRIWNWPPHIENWLYNLSTNLLLERHPPKQMKKRYAAIDVRQENYPGSENTPSQQKIDPAYTGDSCKTKEK